MAKKAYIGVDGKARKIKKGYIGVLDKVVRFDGDMHYDADGEYWVSGSIAYVGSREMFDAAHVEFDGVLYKDLYVETMISNAKTFKYVYIPDTDINIEFNSDGDCELYDPSWELDTGRTYSLKIYTGNLESVARKIKKAYIGIGGVARPCWSGGELAYYGTIEQLRAGRHGLAATTVGNYALFGGGRDSAVYKYVDAYNTSLVRSSPTDLVTQLNQLAATSVGNYAFFAGGDQGGISSVQNKANSYDTSLTRTNLTNLSVARHYLAATAVGEYALFGGGYGSYDRATVDSYNTSLTKGKPTDFNFSAWALAATTVGDYAIFGGGLNGSYYNDMLNAYNKSLTRKTNLAYLSSGRYQLAATTIGDYALFGGGYNKNGVSNVVDVYNTSLTKSIATSLSVARSDLSATTVGNYALFGGGSSGAVDQSPATVDVYDKSLTKTTSTDLNVGRYGLASTTVGNYALFGGGYQMGLRDATVDVYTAD